MQTEYTTGADKPQPPRVGVTRPRNDFGPRQFLACLDVLSRRHAAKAARRSAISRLRGGA